MEQLGFLLNNIAVGLSSEIALYRGFWQYVFILLVLAYKKKAYLGEIV